MDIKRFDLVDCSNEIDNWSDMKKKPFGEYVRYRDLDVFISELKESRAKLAAMEAELYALKAQAAGVWDSAPSHSQQGANKAHLWDGRGVCTKCGTMIFGCLDRCPSHESEQQNDYRCHYCGSNVCECLVP